MEDIIFFVIASTIILVLLAVLVINLLLIGRNKTLQHKNELLKLAADYQKELMVTQLEVMEATFNGISQQLHDDVGQMIAFSIVQLNNLNSDDQDVKTEILNIRHSIQEAMQSLREISKTLNTDYLKTFGIKESLMRLIQRTTKTTGIHIKAELSQSLVFNTTSNEIFTFRIIQELITNTIKHAKATSIELSLEQHQNQIILHYFDNGIGVQGNNIINLTSKNSLGFASITKRSNLMQGNLQIEQVDIGFKLNFSFPNI